MQILDSSQVRAWDEYTIKFEPISSIQLMERAASRCVDWILQNGYQSRSFSVFCGKGNNGGDGLAIARMLSQKGFPVTVCIVEFGQKGTQDFQANLSNLQSSNVRISLIPTEDAIHPVSNNDVIIDALLGSGLNRPVEGLTSKVIEHINHSGNEVLSIDIPSGLFVDKSSVGNLAVKATQTLSFQCFKLAFLVSENEAYIGELHILDIELHPGYLTSIRQEYQLIDRDLIRSFFKRRKKFSHKGNFGHALLVVGSYGKIGAGVLAAKACIKGGVGLLTVHLPSCGYPILQISVPEAMAIADTHDKIISQLPGNVLSFSAIGIGPGIGTAKETAVLLKDLLAQIKKPLVVDADALNLLAKNKDWMQTLPPYSILTPHPKEFLRLFGTVNNDFERINLAKEKAVEHKVVIVLKGRFTLIATPSTISYFNGTGNPGMATGGTGDILTGLLTALLAQGYTPEQASIASCYIHGLAGDLAASVISEEALIASDIIDFFGDAFKELY